MAEREVSDGTIPEAGDVQRLTKLLGRPLHTYRNFAAEMCGWGQRAKAIRIQRFGTPAGLVPIDGLPTIRRPYKARKPRIALSLHPDALSRPPPTTRTR
jgi:hypothetical protein